LTRLYRQHYPGEDEFGDPPWAQQERGSLPQKPVSPPPKKSRQEADAAAPPSQPKPLKD
jgi:hypothetical protein